MFMKNLFSPFFNKNVLNMFLSNNKLSQNTQKHTPLPLRLHSSGKGEEIKKKIVK